MDGLKQLIILLVVVGGGLFLLNLAPIDGTIKRIIQVVLIIVLIVVAINFLWPMAGLG